MSNNHILVVLRLSSTQLNRQIQQQNTYNAVTQS